MAVRWILDLWLYGNKKTTSRLKAREWPAKRKNPQFKGIKGPINNINLTAKLPVVTPNDQLLFRRYWTSAVSGGIEFVIRHQLNGEFHCFLRYFGKANFKENWKSVEKPRKKISTDIFKIAQRILNKFSLNFKHKWYNFFSATPKKRPTSFENLVFLFLKKNRIYIHRKSKPFFFIKLCNMHLTILRINYGSTVRIF